MTMRLRQDHTELYTMRSKAKSGPRPVDAAVRKRLLEGNYYDTKKDTQTFPQQILTHFCFLLEHLVRFTKGRDTTVCTMDSSDRGDD
eukprot:6458641-Amphidinium_carterae.1